MAKYSFLVAVGLFTLPALVLAAEPTPPPAKADEGKVVCRRIAEIGSLAKTTKICKTRKDWKATRDGARAETQTMTQAINAASSN
jgi:hypothetical protein